MTRPIVLYGIPNCDTVKKARAWLAAQGLEHRFHDFKKQGVPADRLDSWSAALGWEKLVNRKGTAWRKLEPGIQASVTDEPSAKALLQAHSSVIKRPVVEWADGGATIGFEPETWASRARRP